MPSVKAQGRVNSTSFESLPIPPAAQILPPFLADYDESEKAKNHEQTRRVETAKEDKRHSTRTGQRMKIDSNHAGKLCCVRW